MKETLTTTSLASLECALTWHSREARHRDTYVLNCVNMWRDCLPPFLAEAFIEKPAGYRTRLSVKPGDVVPPWQNGNVIEIGRRDFYHTIRPGQRIEPRTGRFYPMGMIRGLAGVFRSNMKPVRVVGVGESAITLDFNHPLSAYNLELEVAIADVWEKNDERGGRCNDVIDVITERGPGMQARWQGQPTDFFADQPFLRVDPDADTAFYHSPRLVHHLDATAREQISQLYGELLQPGSRALDLMSSWRSHLPDDLQLASCTGLGLNRAELDENPRLTERVIHDINDDPVLPFSEGVFDAVICTVSVEYMTRPLEVFAQIGRVLKEGGRCIMTFSNRWFPPKVVRIWQELQEFERLGLVTDYFLSTGLFTNIETRSIRGLSRPLDDPYIGQTFFADPVYAVWGERTEKGTFKGSSPDGQQR